MSFSLQPHHAFEPLRAAIHAAYRCDEHARVRALIEAARLSTSAIGRIQTRARDLVQTIRHQRSTAGGVDALMHEFSLSSREGIALMCLAEALLRIPDRATADKLIRDKLASGNWQAHLGRSESLFVNAATWGLVLTGKLVKVHHHEQAGLGAALSRLLERSGEPVIRKGIDAAMRMLGKQFVTGETIDAALLESRKRENKGYRYSYDMLGEAAVGHADAERYFKAYHAAIMAIGEAHRGQGIYRGAGISVKLSALHPRYERAQHAQVMAELLPRVKGLLLLAKQYDLGFAIDAEESDRLELSLDIFEQLALDPCFSGWNGLGIVVQAYQKRAWFVLDWLIQLGRYTNHRWMIRLVKGAYWDSEIKRAQAAGLNDYPVFTRKIHTDVSYLACARKLLNHTDVVYPQFATHNAYTLAAVMEMAGDYRDFEFQCLHGMGETLYDHVVGQAPFYLPCRIYAPVGSHDSLLAYLVRRLLENGANSSFVNRLVNPEVPLNSLLADPIAEADRLNATPHPALPTPSQIYAPRQNAAGVDFSDELVLAHWQSALNTWQTHVWQAYPRLAHSIPQDPVHALSQNAIRNPAAPAEIVGYVRWATPQDLAQALALTTHMGSTLSLTTRAAWLKHMAEQLEQHRTQLLALLVLEAGKTLTNALSEVREAIDFCRYYAQLALEKLHEDCVGVGLVACISPWNFPLAIFVGQIAAALVSGNPVIAKPAEQTPLIADMAIHLFYEAGVPQALLQCLPAHGDIGAALVADARVKAVLFTGSTEVAQQIYQSTARRGNLPLVAETGGQNAMIVDASALPEQVVRDVLESAFDSAGQRCSALRVLCLQEEIAPRVLQLLAEALATRHLGDPRALATDIGPVIDIKAQQTLAATIAALREQSQVLAELPVPAHLHRSGGYFVAPIVVEIPALQHLGQEIFGPVLQVVRYRANELPKLLADIHALGYGLTLGIHSRIDETIDHICQQARVGNIYVNRNMIGAVVGVQPFGGEGLSGTGPKAGGQWYLDRLSLCPTLHAPGLALPLPPMSKHLTATLPPAPPLNGLAPLVKRWASLPVASRVYWLQQVCTHLPHLEGVNATEREHAQQHLLRIVQEATHLFAPQALPSITGEKNTLHLTGRGLVLVLADGLSFVAFLSACTAALAAGNVVIIHSRDPENLAQQSWAAALHAAQLPFAVVYHSAHDLCLSPTIRAIIAPDAPPGLTLQLATRRGAITPLLTPDCYEYFPLHRLAVERCITVNTTAAGGNASLMMLGA